jgi:hypothetical protein
LGNCICKWFSSLSLTYAELIHLSEIYVGRKEDRRSAYRTVVGGNASWTAEDIGGGHVIKIYPGRLKELARYRAQWQNLVLANIKLEFCCQEDN